MRNIKIEDDEELASGNMYPRQIGDNVASSSGSHIRSSFIGMGFSPSLVDKAIKENGEEDDELLLETLFKYSALPNIKPESSDSVGGLPSHMDVLAVVHQPIEEAPHKSCSESSDSLDSLFGDEKGTSSRTNFATDVHLKEEPDITSGVNDEKMASLLAMDFYVDEVEFATDKLGTDAPINEIVDFIFATRIAKKTEKEVECEEGRNEDVNTETLFGTMNKTLRLLEMGFSEQEISAAIEKYGSEISVDELAESIVSEQNGGSCSDKYLSSSLKASKPLNKARPFGGVTARGFPRYCWDDVTVKTEEYSPEDISHSMNIGLMEKYKGKRPKEEYFDEHTSLKRPKEEFDDALSSICPTWLQARHGISKTAKSRVSMAQKQRKARQPDRNVPTLSKPISCRSLDRMVAKPPYFFYGNVMNLSQDSWIKVTQFLYAVEPEFVNTQFFSALSRKEGYVHNLPTENRFHIVPKSPMSIEEAIPGTKRWWPSWDTRKQFSCINAETTGVSQQCDRLERILSNSKGMLSVEQQKDILHRCQSYNLVWVNRNKLKPIEPEHVERILGYPVHHTRTAAFGMTERLESLKHCFQIDTLGYHISVLKSLFPDGLTLLSIYSGIGGAEITLNRLGIRLKAVVSVEPCETKRTILKQWWSNSDQSGELLQIEDIHKLSSSKIETLMKKFGGFNFIVCQNPYSNSSKSPIMSADSGGFAGLDYSLFYEFVRILQRVRSMM